jgi:hypothetical protein
MIRYGLIVILGLQLGLLNKSAAAGQTNGNTPKLADLPTFDNFSAFILANEANGNKSTALGTHKSQLEKSIHSSLKEDPEPFLSDLSAEAVGLTLKLSNGIYVIQRVDGVLTLAAQEIAEEVNNSLSKLKDAPVPAKAKTEIKKILAIEAKRNELALTVAKLKNDYNFNSIFEYMIQANFRKPNRLSQGLPWPPKVQALMWGRKNPHLAAFQTLKALTFDVITADQTNPLVQVRRLKINSTAQMVPFFKPSLHSWEVEAYYFNKKNDRIPSSTKKPSR